MLQIASCCAVQAEQQDGAPFSTPCKGGDTAGIDGEGYCKEGFTGPKCEVRLHERPLSDRQRRVLWL
eukprot:6177818-Pleurochrysis_carterae.AAC.7